MNVAVSGRYLVHHPLGVGVSFSRRIDGESERERLAGHVADMLEGGVVLRTAADRRAGGRAARRCEPGAWSTGSSSAGMRSTRHRRPTSRRAFPVRAIRSNGCCAIMGRGWRR